jgi:bifunctional non-homologous end joining protein LigD
MGLREYFRKRSFTRTPEPKGKKSGRDGATDSPTHRHKLKFVVQEHHATALHYDFRLEMNGVLKSWAVPKGPSMNPHDHHLAIQTEDHPFEYRNFEGVIPEGNYGAGNVIIWDEGTYEPRAEDGDEAALLRDLKKGHITFVLHGKKLHGEFALIRMPHAKEDKAWLLIKKGDEFANEADITKQDESIKSHRKVDDLGAHGKLPDLSGFPKVTKPWTATPMLCTLVDEPFDRDGWLFEIKWDGYRAVGSKYGDDIRLYSRNQLDFREKFAPIVEALHEIKHDVVLDGEVVVVDDNGVAHFEWLQNWGKEPHGSLQYHIFDILWCDGHDVRTMPLIRRKALLNAIAPRSSIIRYSDHVTDKGLKLFHEMQRRGLEGMVAKRANSEYRENVRGADWLKVKTHLRQEVVIGGYTEPRGGRKYLGSLLIGTYEKGEFIYRGHSGGGIPDEQRKQLQVKLAKLERKTSPFNIEPKPNAPVHWVKPEVVCEMEFSEWTKEGYMRQPEFKGLRPDKKAADVRREESKSVSHADPLHESQSVKRNAAGHIGDEEGSERRRQSELPFEPTHLDKVFFPKYKYTKGDLFEYYTAVADYVLPYLVDRPLSLNRMPNGIKGESFFQKNNEHLPDWVPSADIFSDSNNADLHWIVGGTLETLLYIVQLGSIEINPWNSRIKHLEKPDWIVIDLDPEGVTFNDVIKVARTVHDVCDEWDIPAYPKTSGKTGIHIFIPMGAKYTYEQAKNLAHLIVLEVNKRQPKLTSVERNPQKRKHRIYLDFLQNREGQTLAAPYSVRPTDEASVSMPLHWREVKIGLSPMDFTIKNAPARLKRTGDLWKPVVGKGIDLSKVLKKIESSNK